MEQIIFKCSWQGLAHEHQMRSLKLLDEEVLPRVRDWHRESFPREAAE